MEQPRSRRFQGNEKAPRYRIYRDAESLRPKYQYLTEARMEKLKQAFPAFRPTSLENAVDDYVTSYLLSGRTFE